MWGWRALLAWWNRKRTSASGQVEYAPTSDAETLRTWIEAEAHKLYNVVGFISGGSIVLPRYVHVRFAHGRWASKRGAKAWCHPVPGLNGAIVTIRIAAIPGLRLDALPTGGQAYLLRGMLAHELAHALPIGAAEDPHGASFVAHTRRLAAILSYLPPDAPGTSPESWPFPPARRSWLRRLCSYLAGVPRVAPAPATAPRRPKPLARGLGAGTVSAILRAGLRAARPAPGDRAQKCSMPLAGRGSETTPPAHPPLGALPCDARQLPAVDGFPVN
jgi:hypothetical protein